MGVRLLASGRLSSNMVSNHVASKTFAVTAQDGLVRVR
jgi:hypothetical protein